MISCFLKDYTNGFGDGSGCGYGGSSGVSRIFSSIWSGYAFYEHIDGTVYEHIDALYKYGGTNFNNIDESIGIARYSHLYIEISKELMIEAMHE